MCGILDELFQKPMPGLTCCFQQFERGAFAFLHYLYVVHTWPVVIMLVFAETEKLVLGMQQKQRINNTIKYKYLN